MPLKLYPNAKALTVKHYRPNKSNTLEVRSAEIGPMSHIGHHLLNGGWLKRFKCLSLLLLPVNVLKQLFPRQINTFQSSNSRMILTSQQFPEHVYHHLNKLGTLPNFLFWKSKLLHSFELILLAASQIGKCEPLKLLFVCYLHTPLQIEIRQRLN